MKEAGARERERAVEHGDLTDDGILFIIVIIDGGWSFRSHGHRYTLNSGLACVIGARTKKLLDEGVRNKYCSICEYRKKNQLGTDHTNCFKNLDRPSPSMEMDMIVECFQRSVQLHGGVIIHNSKIGDVSGLQQDLVNGPRHVFGNHASCKPYFCTKLGETADLSEKLRQAYEKARSCLQPLISKSHQLISNNTSEAAENYTALVAKFLGPKQANMASCRKSLSNRKEAAKSCRPATLPSSPRRRRKTVGKANNGAQDYGELATRLDIGHKEMEDLEKEKLQDLTLYDDEITALEIETRGRNENEK
ncbi:hypothetical protein PR048_025188 [Dryococelus australis]|uniref:Mutator-like transposase domain-containing protein n=1 Tax=Dryococelus australis TaxID=614101 RepID=A0ABQ9GQQ2_9NEOP|nr:hypothetical protein PR048_025188 [Dryococelus australis]